MLLPQLVSYHLHIDEQASLHDLIVLLKNQILREGEFGCSAGFPFEFHRIFTLLHLDFKMLKYYVSELCSEVYISSVHKSDQKIIVYGWLRNIVYMPH